MNILVLQHLACESPGLLAEILRERGDRIEFVELDKGQPMPPSPDPFDAILAMGGPTGVNNEAAFPWMRKEKAFIARAVPAEVPYLGPAWGRSFWPPAGERRSIPDSARKLA